MSEVNCLQNVDDMNAGELRTELRAMGMSTKVKSIEKLRNLVRKERKATIVAIGAYNSYVVRCAF